jgi:hypothetical protein
VIRTVFKGWLEEAIAPLEYLRGGNIFTVILNKTDFLMENYQMKLFMNK